MRISENQVQVPQVLRQTETQQKHYDPNFKGVDTFVVSTMDAIERGGLAASFIIQDTLGTNIPRPVMGLMRNQKENSGKKNTAFALKEAIREFTTGPSMFAIPGMILFAVGKAGATALKVPTQFIKGLGDIYKNTINADIIKLDNDSIKKAFYTDVLGNILEETTGKPKETFKQQIEELAEGINNYERAGGNGVIDNFTDRIKPGTKEDIISKLTEAYVKITKGNIDPDKDFLTVNLKNTDIKDLSNGDGVISTSFKKVVDYMTQYSTDAINKTKKATTEFSADNFKKLAGEFVENFNVKRINGRFALNIGMIAAITSFLTIIPKLYNATSKDNPGMVGLIEESPTTNTTVATTNQTTSNQPKEVKKGEA